MKPKIENKEALIKAARIAFSPTMPTDFWDELKRRMDIREQSLVKPRKLAH